MHISIDQFQRVLKIGMHISFQESDRGDIGKMYTEQTRSLKELLSTKMIYIDVQNPISTQQQFVNADKFRIVISNVAVLNCRIPPFRYLHFTNVSERI